MRAKNLKHNGNEIYLVKPLVVNYSVIELPSI